MSTVKVTMELPFFLRLEAPISVSYNGVCSEPYIPELSDRNIRIEFSRRPVLPIDRSGWQYVRTTVTITLNTPRKLSVASVNTFAIQNCLEILNGVITSYQATTGEVHNAGIISPLGMSDMQLFADIRVNGKDFRDRWPGHNLNTIPLQVDKLEEFNNYLSNQNNIPLSRLFLTNASLSLQRGQYPLAILQGATAVELRVTQVIIDKLKTSGWSMKAIEPYGKMTLGNKLQLPRTDPRSLETYFNEIVGFSAIYKKVRDDLIPLRNKVTHRGYLPSHQEALLVVMIARDFLSIVT